MDTIICFRIIATTLRPLKLIRVSKQGAIWYIWCAGTGGSHARCIIHTGCFAHENNKVTIRGRSRHKNNSKRGVRNMEGKKSTREKITSLNICLNNIFPHNYKRAVLTPKAEYLLDLLWSLQR